MKIRNLFLFVFFLPFVCFCADDSGVAGANTASGAAPRRSAGVDVQAEKSGFRDGWILLENNVIIRHDDTQLTADRAKIHKDSGDIIAEGNVVIIRELYGAVRTDSLSYNYITGVGLSNKIDLESGRYRVMADAMKRTKKASYDLKNSVVTTCTNDPSSLHYAVASKDAEFMPGQYVQMRGARVRLFGTTVFGFPLVRRSLVDHFGWSFIPGYESDWGGYLLSSYRTQLVDLGGPHNDSVNSKTHFDYRTERGFALGEDIGWNFGDLYNGGSQGMIGVYGIFDDNPMDSDYDRDPGHDTAEDMRYRITLRHDTYFTEADYLTVRSSYMSDSYVFPDFYEDEYEDYIQPESYASYTHNGVYFLYGLTVDHRVNEFYQNVNRLPEMTFDINLIELGQTGLYYQSETEGGLLQYEYADYGTTNAVPESYDTLRIDSLHSITYPFMVSGFLSVVPRVAYRGTYYSKTKENRLAEKVEPGTTDVVTYYKTEEAGAGLRNLFEIGSEISFKAYGFFNGDNGTLYRHIVEPYANWTYIPEPNIRPDELFHFDYIDDLDYEHTVKVGIRQLLEKKLVDKSVTKIVDFDFYAIYYFDNPDGYSGVKTYGVDTVLALSDSIKIDADAVFDAELNEIDHIDFWISLWQDERWEAAGQIYYIPEKEVDSEPVYGTTLFRGDVRYTFSESFSIGSYIRYDSQLSRCEKIAGYLQYNLDCLSFRLASEFVPAFTRDDGTEREAKTRVSFNAWVREFTPTKYEQKLRDKYWDD